MNAEVQRDLLLRIGELQRRGVRYREGIVTAVSPLSVAVGDADTSWTNLPSLGGPHQVSEKVALLLVDNAAIVLGTVGSGPEPWTAVSGFTNSWVNFGATNQAMFYRDTRAKRLYCRGLVKNGTVGYATPMFTFPVGYRSPVEIEVACSANVGHGVLYTAPSGVVSLAAGSNVYVDLSPLEFRYDL